jgi:hypothetical protein
LLDPFRPPRKREEDKDNVGRNALREKEIANVISFQESQLHIHNFLFQSLLSIGGISVMYKVQLLGPQNVLHKYEPFLLNPPICMLLYLLSSAVVSASSCVVYMYGYHK